MKWWQKVGAWMGSSAWPFLKKHWKAVALVAGTILAALFGKVVVGLVRNAVLGKVNIAHNFRILDNDHIEVENATSGKWETVDLTTITVGKVKAANVRAVQLVPGGPAKVEVVK